MKKKNQENFDKSGSSNRMVFLFGEITEDGISKAMGEIVSLANENSSEPITLIISTEGGSVDDMFSLYDMMKYISCPIHTVGMGKIFSAGVPILAAGVKGKRKIGKHAYIMIHAISDELTGDLFQIEKKLAVTKKSQKMMEDLFVRETKMSAEFVSSLMKEGSDFYFSSQEALELGIVDEIIE